MSLDVQLKNGLILGFPTPMLRQQVADAEKINPALKKEILKRAKSSPSASRNNVGAWRSADDLLSWPVAEIETIKKAINRAVAQLTQLTIGQSGKQVRGEINAVAWATVCRPGDYLKPHIHPLSTWSGFYIVAGEADTDGHPESGVAEFLDPRTATNQLHTPGNPFGGTLRVKPVPGLIFVHPGWLSHFVNPYRGAGERIAIGFNVFVRGAADEDVEADGDALARAPVRIDEMG